MNPLPELSDLETRVMQVLWEAETRSADEVRRALASEHELTDSSVRTVLRRLETKGYVDHEREGKRFLYRAVTPRRHAAAAAVRRIVNRICGGDANSLVVGMLEDELISRKEFDEAQRMLAAAGRRKRRSRDDR